MKFKVLLLKKNLKKKKNYLLDNIDWLVFLIVVYTGKKKDLKKGPNS